jgi:hypothetical protein
LLYCFPSARFSVYCLQLWNPNARDGGRVSAGTQCTCFIAFLVLGSQFTVCSSGIRMRGTAGGCLLLLALRPLSVRSKPPPSPGPQFKFTCFARTTVQILTPESCGAAGLGMLTGTLGCGRWLAIVFSCCGSSRRIRRLFWQWWRTRSPCGRARRMELCGNGA